MSETVIPEISIVVCSRNRADRLDTFFESLRQLSSGHAWELVLVDSASTDDTFERFRAFANDFGIPTTVVRAAAKGLGRARNVGWRTAKAPIIAFFDDDCYAAPDFLDRVSACFRDSPALGFMGGRVELFDPDDLPVTIKTSRDRASYAGRRFVLAAGEIHGANMAIRSAALEAVNGFDDNFGAGTAFPCEDVDVLARLLQAGWNGVYEPEAVVHHHHGRRTSDEFAALMKAYDKGRGAYFAKMLLQGQTQYLRPWVRRFRYQRPAASAREVRSAVLYLAQTVTGQNRSPTSH